MIILKINRKCCAEIETVEPERYILFTNKPMKLITGKVGACETK